MVQSEGHMFRQGECLVVAELEVGAPNPGVHRSEKFTEELPGILVFPAESPADSPPHPLGVEGRHVDVEESGRVVQHPLPATIEEASDVGGYNLLMSLVEATHHFPNLGSQVAMLRLGEGLEGEFLPVEDPPPCVWSFVDHELHRGVDTPPRLLGEVRVLLQFCWLHISPSAQRLKK